jgi:hypothetical protein
MQREERQIRRTGRYRRRGSEKASGENDEVNEENDEATTKQLKLRIIKLEKEVAHFKKYAKRDGDNEQQFSPITQDFVLSNFNNEEDEGNDKGELEDQEEEGENKVEKKRKKIKKRIKKKRRNEN